ncbi:MAG: aminopeptidase P family protein [Armatimonadetes bacterium]|nr:aminopeptidase P family protein [Armatimonadota bacterium]
MTQQEEIIEKQGRIGELMRNHSLDAIAITNTGNFAWLTCGGANYVGVASDMGVATAVVTQRGKYIVCDNIEERRIADEEVVGQEFEFITHPWQENRRDEIIKEIADGGRLGSDVPMKGAVNISSELDSCRQSLTDSEIERYRWLGANAGECLSLTCREIQPGMTEHEIAGRLNRHLNSRGIVTNLALVAVDERISRYRHPLPTDKKLQRYAMVVTGARKWGLIVSATRIVHFGPIDSDLRRRHNAVAGVDAVLISNTKPSARMGDIFRSAVNAYESAGFGEEWRQHHQGGPTGYRAREFRVSESTEAEVVANQAFAWNPSITGTKTEDTIIATSSGPIILSETPDWPKIEAHADDTVIARPDILVR